MKGLKMGAVLIGVTVLAAAILATQGFGAATKTDVPLTTQNIGLVDPAMIQGKFPDYLRLLDLKKAYDQELNVYAAYVQSQLQSYLMELKKQEEAESEGKSAEQKKVITEKYAKLAAAKKTEISQQIQVKQRELQEKLNGENAKADAKVTAAIEATCGEKGIAIVFNKTAIYYGGNDITPEVIAKGK